MTSTFSAKVEQLRAARAARAAASPAEAVAPPVAPGEAAPEIAARPAAETRPWSAIVCGLPEDRTLVIVDWLMLAARSSGMAARALPLGGDSRTPYGMYVEIGEPGELELHGSPLPWNAVDLLVAGEHMELARALACGYASPDITTVVASCHRSFVDAERVVLASHVLREREIDRLAEQSASRYVAFDAREVCGWYRLSERAEPGLLLGAALGTGALGVDLETCELAITLLEVDVRASLAGVRRGQRFGRRGGGRVRRTLTAAQFVRTRRSALPRPERQPFEQLIERIEREFDAAHRPALREGAYLLSDFHCAAYAARYIDMCAAVARDETAAVTAGHLPQEADASVVPLVARHLAGLLAYPDLPWVAQQKLRRGRLRRLRQWHGIGRDVPYSVRELIPADAYERAQLAPQWRANRIDPTGSPLLAAARTICVETTTVRGAFALRRLRRLRTRRESSARHVAELDTADAFVSAVREALRAGPEFAHLVAASGAIVQGAGAARAASRTTAEAFWGKVVRPALALDRSSPDGQPHISRHVIARVYAELCSAGPLALWDYAAQMVGIALHQSRGGSYDQALTFVRALCGQLPLAPEAPPAEEIGTTQGEADAADLRAQDAAGTAV